MDSNLFFGRQSHDRGWWLVSPGLGLECQRCRWVRQRLHYQWRWSDTYSSRWVKASDGAMEEYALLRDGWLGGMEWMGMARVQWFDAEDGARRSKIQKWESEQKREESYHEGKKRHCRYKSGLGSRKIEYYFEVSEFVRRFKRKDRWE